LLRQIKIDAPVDDPAIADIDKQVTVVKLKQVEAVASTRLSGLIWVMNQGF
jgi:hypothetical protein